jgi:hypothetical protein
MATLLRGQQGEPIGSTPRGRAGEEQRPAGMSLFVRINATWNNACLIHCISSCRQAQIVALLAMPTLDFRFSNQSRSSRRFLTADRNALSIRLDLDKRAGG